MGRKMQPEHRADGEASEPEEREGDEGDEQESEHPDAELRRPGLRVPYDSRSDADLLARRSPGCRLGVGGRLLGVTTS
jgi:hypothetical protein